MARVPLSAATLYRHSQDPTSDNLGTTIWDASIILVRYMERNPHLYSRKKLAGKRVLELGAGCGLAGMYFALQGAHVTFTDLAEVLPLLRRNVNMNLGGGEYADGLNQGLDGISKPKIDVVEYCWGTPLDALEPPYDFVVACDCVYVERLVDALVSSMTRLSGRNTTVLVASEKREEVTYVRFRERLALDFMVRQAPRRHMDKAYDHENSEVLLCKLRRSAYDLCSKVKAESSRAQEVVIEGSQTPRGARPTPRGQGNELAVLPDQEREEEKHEAPTATEPPLSSTLSDGRNPDARQRHASGPDDLDLSLDGLCIESLRVLNGSEPKGRAGKQAAPGNREDG